MNRDENIVTKAEIVDYAKVVCLKFVKIHLQEENG